MRWPRVLVAPSSPADRRDRRRPVTAAEPVLLLPIVHRSRPSRGSAARPARAPVRGQRAGAGRARGPARRAHAPRERRWSAPAHPADPALRHAPGQLLGRRDRGDDGARDGASRASAPDQGVAVEMFLLLDGFRLAAAVLDASWRWLGMSSLPTPQVSGGDMYGGTLLLATPVVNAWSRSRAAGRSICARDRLGAGCVHQAVRRMAAHNLAEEHPSSAAFLLLSTPIRRRAANRGSAGRSESRIPFPKSRIGIPHPNPESNPVKRHELHLRRRDRIRIRIRIPGYGMRDWGRMRGLGPRCAASCDEFPPHVPAAPSCLRLQ